MPISVSPFFANAGVPMLYLQVPMLAVMLPVVIGIEAYLCRRRLALQWGRTFATVTLGNLISTFLGFPLLWIALVGLQLITGGGGMSPATSTWSALGITVREAAWLAPYDDRLYWMVPVASMVLMVPSFFVSVGIEGLCHRLVLKNRAAKQAVWRATWMMHLVSYAVLLMVPAAYLIYEVWKKEANK